MHTQDNTRRVLERGRSNEVELKIDGSDQVESVLLAYRKDGEVHVLAERTGPASATIEGKKLPE